MTSQVAPGWGNRSLNAIAGLFALFLALPVLALIGRAVLDGSLADAISTPAVLDALWLSLALAMSSTALVLPISGTQGPVGRAALSMLLLSAAGVSAQEVSGGATTAAKPMAVSPSVSQAMAEMVSLP